MSLTDDAIKAYEKQQLEEKENKEKEMKKYIDDSTKTIKGFFGENLDIDTIEDKDKLGNDSVAFLVDGLKMISKRNRGYYEIYLVQKCQRCGSEFEDHIVNISNIGKAIKDGHWSLDCDNVLKAKKPERVLSTEERLVEVLRDFISENSNIG